MTGSVAIKMSNMQRVVYDVIIVGAGAAGLGASRELQSRGIDSFIILEGSDRTGGRINTLKTESGVPIDLGAQWLHGEHGNSIYHLSQGKKLLQEKLSLDGAGDFCTENGQRIASSTVEETLDVLSDISEECKLFFETSNCNSKSKTDAVDQKLSNIERPVTKNISSFDYSEEGWSVGAFYRARFEEYLNSCTADSAHDIKLKTSLFNWVLRWELIDNACDDMFDISAKRWGEYIMCDGRNNMNPIDGMITLLDRASEGVPRSKILFNKNVEEINYDVNSFYQRGKLKRKSGEAPIIIKCGDDTEYWCDHVIVTVSLGILKTHSDMFVPPLSSNLQKAINSIGFGTLDKIFLEFPYEWWPEDFVGLQFIWMENKLMDEEQNRKGSHWFRGITGFDAIPGKKNILCGWIGGREASDMERMDSRDVTNKCVDLLKMFSGREDIPAPIAIYRSSWFLDPLFLGTYSNRPTSTEDVSSQELNVPIYCSCDQNIPLVVLAGEANSLNFFSTVHGAFDNGVAQTRHYIKHRRNRTCQHSGLRSKL